MMNSEDWRDRAEKAEAALARAERENVALANASTTTAEALATARAAAFEEARRGIAAAFEEDEDVSAIDVLEKLAPLPAGLVVLPVEVTEWIADHLTTELRNMNESDSCDDCGTLDDHESDCFALELERRIAALDAVGGER